MTPAIGFHWGRRGSKAKKLSKTINYFAIFIAEKQSVTLQEQFTVNRLIDHLFRHESGKIVSVLTHIFGPDNLVLAEDVVQDSLVEAIQQWSYKGIPANPSGWLFRVAKNKALNIVNREGYKLRYTTEVAHLLQSEWTAGPAADILFSDEQVLDDQLRMMFTCCHPSITPDSQVALILKTLCGFSIPEIASAFLSNEENVNKRLVRARQKIRESKIPFEMPPAGGLKHRLQAVLETIYLLFNEGYSASSGSHLIRYELCGEAIRLAGLVAACPSIPDNANVYALLALMQLNASRFNARLGEDGSILTLELQNRSLWNVQLMRDGFGNFERSMQGEEVSIYHILAAISSCHCAAATYDATNWTSILALYNQLIELDNSPVVLLNRAVALGRVSGPKAALAELDSLQNVPSLKTYYLFYSVQAEFFMETERYGEAVSQLQKAIRLAPLEAEKTFLEKKLANCYQKIV